jgi:antitoxin FitA
MPKTVNLQNIPDHLYERLRLAAKANGRSMNREVIGCLESVFPRSPVSVAECLSRARALRNELPQGKFEPAEIDAFKRDGAH